MLAETVLVTRLLGLMAGTRTVEAQVDPNVHAIEIVLDGQTVTTMRGAPWRTTIDFGRELAPHEVTAIARDAEGHEIGRDTQFINLARPRAEVGVMFTRPDGKLRANISAQHVGAAVPVAMNVKLDGKTIAKNVAKSIALPESGSPALHILSVDVLFNDGSKAQREVTFGGIYSEELPAELTATIVRQRGQGRTDLARCFTSDGAFVRAEAVDAGEAAVMFVRSINPSAAMRALLSIDSRERRIPESAFMMPHTALRFVWPVASDSGDAELFATSHAFDGIRGVRWLLTRVSGPPNPSERMIDAVTIAGTEALAQARRRAVVVVLGNERGRSRYPAGIVKRYLERIRVPLHVWSLRGGETDAVWGEVEDVSTSSRLRDAVDRLRRELDEQRIAWLALDPYRALRVETADDCAWTTATARADAAARPAAR